MPDNVRLITEGSGEDVKYYAQLGADAGTKKLLGSSAELLWTNPSVTSQATIVAPCDWSKYDNIIILYSNHYNSAAVSRYISLCDIGSINKLWPISGENNAYRFVRFDDKKITMYVPADTVEHNWGSYNIPLKIWGAYTEEDFYSYP